MDRDPIQRQRPARREHARLPHGFFDGAPQHGTHRSFSPSPSSTSRPHEFLVRFTSLFHSPQPTIGESMELQQGQRQHMSSHPGPSAIEVAPVRDKQVRLLSFFHY
ncbi:hypothetical protein AZE42_09099 [Rhizopogon vesiculosus]|uniref:Uncharacterized protein n=1 Tax=Rhizopogon vesiculosus TaxID=180088 RepID=A0A1J8QHB1_9AGAM|nr:hypothetical protein AZE42_09099 [Rhizopogon vesiculosus]